MTHTTHAQIDPLDIPDDGGGEDGGGPPVYPRRDALRAIAARFAHAAGTTWHVVDDDGHPILCDDINVTAWGAARIVLTVRT